VLDVFTLRRLNAGHVGVTDVACPLCGPDCRSAANRARKVLRIWDDGEFVTFKCVRCEVGGWVNDARNIREQRPQRPRTETEPGPDRAELARRLWSRSLPLTGSLAETYLHARGCFVASPSLRYLPPRGSHSPTMIGRFGTAEVTGVHLTKLSADGSAKAGTEKDKVMIGPSAGQPIVVSENLEHPELIIAEGIEDAASLSRATGWSAWAAGAAGRIALILTLATRFSPIYIAVDDDRAGRVALERSLVACPDLVPLNFGKLFSRNTGMDANRALREFGPDMIVSAIEWATAQCEFRRGKISFGAMEHAQQMANAAFRSVLG
jgi:hypothetical protein